jgi:hypothetical protein
MTKDTIKDFYGKIIGSIETDSNGNKRAKDFYGRILGSYDKKLNLTKDFFGKILGSGDFVVGLIYDNNNKKS